MRPDPRELRRIQWLPPLRLQLRLGAPPDSMSEENRQQLARAHARRRGGMSILVGLAISSLVAGSSVSGASASADGSAAGATERPTARVGVGAEPVPLGYPWAMVPDNQGKGNGTLPDVPTTSTVPVSDVTDLGIPDVALDAYRTAAVSMGDADADCKIDWSLIAGVGRVETNHGQYGDRRPAADGAVQPPILGIALDGRPGVALIRDTDDGRLDFDTTYDRAVGPMQFIPSTWSAFPDADGDGNGVVDPHNLYDAALAAASYLCSGPGDLSTEFGQRSAVFRYNHSDSYVDLVLFYADAYARGVQPSGPPPEPAGPPPVVPRDPVTDPAHPPGDPTPPPSTPPPTTTSSSSSPPTTTTPTTTTPTTTTPTTTDPSATTTDPSGTTDPSSTTTDPSSTTGSTESSDPSGTPGSTGSSEPSATNGSTDPNGSPSASGTSPPTP